MIEFAPHDMRQLNVCSVSVESQRALSCAGADAMRHNAETQCGETGCTPAHPVTDATWVDHKQHGDAATAKDHSYLCHNTPQSLHILGAARCSQAG